LIEERKVPATTSPWLKSWIKNFTKTKRPVIEGESSGSAVVTVKVSLAIAYANPIGD
jgi:hypothetical protein